MICIRDCVINTLIFCKGLEYDVRYNNVDGRIYIYNPWGYTDINKETLNRYFL